MTMNIDQSNISNLTSLWRQVVKNDGQFVPGKDYDYSLHTQSDWPNRLWFHGDITSDLLVAASRHTKTIWPFIIPYWDIYNNPDSHDIFLDCGYQLKTRQYGMYLELNTDLQDDVSDIHFEKVSSSDQAILWSGIFSSAFGYHINEQLLITKNNIDVLLIYASGKPIGTMMLHSSEPHMTGIHSMGILPDMQQSGYGGKIMKKVLYEIQSNGFRWVTLQASEAGLGLYQKLGFRQQFLMRNYTLK